MPERYWTNVWEYFRLASVIVIKNNLQRKFESLIKIARAFSVWYFANQIEYTECKTVRCVKNLVYKVWPTFTWSQICFGLNFIHFHCSIYCSLMFHFLFAYSFVERFGRQTRWDWETKIGKLEISFSRPRNDGNTYSLNLVFLGGKVTLKIEVVSAALLFQEGKLSYEEAILARQTMIKQNQQRVMEIKQEVGIILSTWE